MAVVENLFRSVRGRPAPVVVATAALVVLLFLAGAVHNYFLARTQEIADSQEDADSALLAIDDHVTRLIDDSDSYLRVLRSFYLDRGLADTAARYALRQFIERTRPGDPRGAIGDIMIVDAAGHPTFILSQPEPARTELADRTYFKALQADPRDRTIIDATRQGRATGEYQFRVIRPILVDGAFGGVVMMTLRPEAIVDLFSKFGLGEHSTIAILHSDERRFIARVPMGDLGYLDRTFADIRLWDFVAKAPRGKFHGISPIDHVGRFYTYMKSPDEPIVSVVGFADEDIDAALAATRRDIAVEVLVFTLFAGALCGLILRIMRVQGRLRWAMASLEHGQRIGRIGSVEVDLVRQRARWSKELYAIYGRDPALGPADLETFLAYVHPADRDKAEEMRRRQLDGIEGGPIEYRIVRPDGAVRWIHREVELQRDAAGRAVTLIATEQDITERRRMEDELQREHARLMVAQRMAQMGSAEVDLRTGAVVRSDEFFRLVGANESTPSDSPDQVALVFHPEDREKVAQAVTRMMAGKPVPSMELRVVGARGEMRWIRRDQEIIRGEGGAPERAVVTLRDITDEKRLEQQKDEFAATLMSLANHDELTGLPALRLARDRLQVACNQAARDNARVALLYIDLDGFKDANDRFGHAAGDHVLKVVASRLVENIRSGDTAARHGGDEFLVILHGIHTDTAQQVAAKLVEAIALPIGYGEEMIRIGASIGIAIFPDHADTPDELMEFADRAMYAVKRSGKNGYGLYAEGRQPPSPT